MTMNGVCACDRGCCVRDGSSRIWEKLTRDKAQKREAGGRRWRWRWDGWLGWLGWKRVVKVNNFLVCMADRLG